MLHIAMKRIKKVAIDFRGLRAGYHNVKLNAVKQKYITEEYMKKTNGFGVTSEFYTIL